MKGGEIMNTFKKLWENEIKTKQQLLEKEKETKEQYKNYKKLVGMYDWKKSVVNENIKGYKKTLEDIKNWKKEM